MTNNEFDEYIEHNISAVIEDYYWKLDEIIENNDKYNVKIPREILYNEYRDITLTDFNYGWHLKKNTDNSPNLSKYDFISEFIDGYALVIKKYKRGIIDINGNEIVPCIYERIYTFSNGLARVKKRCFYGFINKKGEEVIPCDTYCRASDFNGKAIIVGKIGAMGEPLFAYIDGTGKLLPITISRTLVIDYDSAIDLYFKKGKYTIISDTKRYLSVFQFENDYVFIYADTQEELLAKKIQLKKDYRKYLENKTEEQLSMIDDSTIDTLNTSYQKKLK